MYQHEISIISDSDGKSFPLVAVTNLDFAKTLHIGKGGIIGFARPESEEVMYIATSDEINMDPYIDNAPHNWIPPRNRKTLNQTEKRQKVTKTMRESTVAEHNERLYDESPRSTQERQQFTPTMVKVKAKEPEGEKNRERLSDKSMNRCPQPEEGRNQQGGTEMKRHFDESRESQSVDSWDMIHEVIESDFLISPGDIYPSRKVELQDAEVSEETLHKFEVLCEEQHEAFSKNNQDIGKTQLIEMEIDTGNSVPLAQSPYTLPLKHYDWVRKEIETLEKAGVIE